VKNTGGEKERILEAPPCVLAVALLKLFLVCGVC